MAEDLEKIRGNISRLLLRMVYENAQAKRKRVTFRSQWSPDEAFKWLESLAALVKTYKWSESISALDLFEGREMSYWNDRVDVRYQFVLEIASIFQSFGDEDKQALANSVAAEFNKVFKEPEPEPEPGYGSYGFGPEPEDDDVPF